MGEWWATSYTNLPTFPIPSPMISSPMTDLEKFIELYASVGIKLKATHYPEGRRNVNHPTGSRALILAVDGTEPLIDGYIYFMTEIVFDDGGKFVFQGIWE